MRKNILSSVAIAGCCCPVVASCNKSQPQVEAKSESKAPAELKIAYVEVDSIMTQYTFAKEYSSILEKKGQNIQATIAQKGQQPRPQQPTSSRRFSRMLTPASRLRLSRLDRRSRTTTAGLAAALEQRVCC